MSWLAGLFAKLPGLSSAKLIGIAGLFLGGVWTGYWGTSTLYKSGEVKALEGRINELSALRKSDISILQKHYKTLLEIERHKATINEVVNNVPDNRDCDLTPPIERMLDRHRQAVRTDKPAAGVNEGAATSATTPRISQRQLVFADADLADLYNAARSQIKSLIEIIQTSQRARQ